MKRLIPVMVILLLISISFVGVGNQVEGLMVDSSEIVIDDYTIAYGYCRYDPSGLIQEGPVRFHTDDPGNVTQLWSTTSPAPMTAGAWTYDGWFCFESGTGELWHIDLDSGYMIEIGGGGVHLNGLTWGPYGLLASRNSSLYDIDEDNGELSLIADFILPSGRKMGSISMDCICHSFYGVEYIDDVLYYIDMETGATEPIGPLGIDIDCNAEFECAHDSEDNNLYLSSKGGLYKVDKEIGKCTLVGEFQGGAVISAMIIEPDRFYQPTANFSWELWYPEPGDAIIFNASSSHYEGGDIKRYEWDWDNDLIFDENSTSPTASHTWNEEGFFPVTLMVYVYESKFDTQRYIVKVENPSEYELSITGPRFGKAGPPLGYGFNTTIPKGEEIWLSIDWGD